MICSMTGFGSSIAEVRGLGKISVELRSSNHKFLETVFHLPEGFLFLEGRIKKEIETRVKRGRVTCVINIIGAGVSIVAVNKALLKNYIVMLKAIKKQYQLKDEISINSLINLPGILSVGQSCMPGPGIWPRLKFVLNRSLDGLLKMRQKEGRATFHFLNNRAQTLLADLVAIKARFKRAIRAKLDRINTDEERSAFLKDADIAEEIERLGFHIRNFKSKLLKSVPVGKELDFIAQEMQREANTMAAKSFDAAVSARVVQVKSQIEKIREQVQNIE